jgi:hypothetical protein
MLIYNTTKKYHIMGKIKTFEEYQTEKGTSGEKNEMYRELNITKEIDESSCCSKELQEKMWEVCEAACMEMQKFNEDEHEENTAKLYNKGFITEMKKIMGCVQNECGKY